MTTGVVLLGRGSSDAGANGELAKMARWVFEDNEHELVDLAFTGVTWPRLETVVQRQAKPGHDADLHRAGVPLHRGADGAHPGTGRAPAAASTRSSPSRSAPTSASTRAFSICSTARLMASCRKAGCSNATAASTERQPRRSICMTTAIPPCLANLQAAATDTKTGMGMEMGMTTHISRTRAAPTNTIDYGETMTTNTVTEQLTEAGRAIEHDSFAVIDAEAGPHNYSAEQWPLVRRMIHANADFEFNGLTAFHPDAMRAGFQAVLKGNTPIVADVEMICVGLSKPRLQHFGLTTHHYISDEDVIAQAKLENSTRAVQAMRKAHRLGKLDSAIVGIGNAPTALIELVRLIREEGVRPALVVAMPVGFVSAAESKDLMMMLNDVPWVAIKGRKGGSTLVVAAIHAMLSLAEAEQKKLAA
jgi:precorrin-8X/cobalt-precorrin-8 methylmutase